MNLMLTEDQNLIKDTAQKFLQSRIPTASVRAQRDNPQGFSADLWDALAQQGWLGLALPENYAGAGAGFFEACLLVEQMGWAAIPTPFLTTLAASLAIYRYGSAEQQATWLPAIATGRRIVSYARPGGGLSTPPMTALLRGNHYELQGTAWFVPFANVAHAFIVAAATDPAQPDRLTVFVVDGEADLNIHRRPLDSIGWDHPHHVKFSHVAVPCTAILGEAESGGAVVDALEAWGAAASAVEMAGGAQRVLDLTVEYATQRTQFDRPIGSFQAVQHHCANMAIDVLSARFMAYEAAWRLSEGLPAGRETAMAKAWVGDAYLRVVDLGHQVHGAIGFTQDHDLQFYLRHAMAASLNFGDTDLQWERVADSLGLPRA